MATTRTGSGVPEVLPGQVELLTDSELPRATVQRPAAAATKAVREVYVISPNSGGPSVVCTSKAAYKAALAQVVRLGGDVQIERVRVFDAEDDDGWLTAG